MMSLPVNGRRAAMAAWDALSWTLALLVLALVRYDFTLTDAQWMAALQYTGAAIGLTIAGGFFFHLYLGRSRVGSFAEATAVAVLVGGVALVLGVVFIAVVPHFARGVALVLPPLALMVMGFGRWAFRTTFRRIQDLQRAELLRSAEASPAKALVYGAGDDGHDVARLVDLAKQPPYEIVGFLDDDPTLRHRRIRSYRVLGRRPDERHQGARGRGGHPGDQRRLPGADGPAGR